ncbi:MAG: endonuclease/exonuclease/phosphatase family protein [Bacteroidales bacterium]|nr:endonuclease/exonuclease/phosphatase family protein [Candidatus Cacconaster merdequi]
MRLSKIILFSVLCLLTVGSNAQDWPNLNRFCDADRALSSYTEGKVVLMGDSITDFWLRRDPEFVEKYGFIFRGISGQTTSQMLLRFRHDVIETGASTVVILAGTNDIAGNTGPVSLETVLGNLASMCDLARTHGIKPILCSLLPAKRYSWNKSVRPDILIPQLNAMLKEYADKERITYVDMFDSLADHQNPENENGMFPDFSKDGVHPTLEGYKVMDALLLQALKPSKVKAALKDNAEGLKLMSYNVRNCKGMDKTVNFDRVAAVINDYNAKAVAIQELDSVTVRYGHKDVLKELAYRTGMVPTYARAIDFEGGGYGIGMLSREKPIRFSTVPLPGREERRVLLMAEFSDFIYCNMHLSLTDEDRIASVGIVVDAVKAFKAESPEKPLFIAGDWNAGPASETLRLIREYFDILTDTSINTFPSDKPRSTIDFIAAFKGADIKVLDTAVPAASQASDHRPVFCKVKMAK